MSHIHAIVWLDQIAEALVGVREVLIGGPGNAKTAFKAYIDDRHVDLASRVVGVERLDHPTNAELLARKDVLHGNRSAWFARSMICLHTCPPKMSSHFQPAPVAAFHFSGAPARAKISEALPPRKRSRGDRAG